MAAKEKTFCTTCGSSLRPGVSFCTVCGIAIGQEAETYAPARETVRAADPPRSGKKSVDTDVPPPRVLPAARVTDPTSRISKTPPVPPPLPPEAMPPPPPKPATPGHIVPVPPPDIDTSAYFAPAPADTKSTADDHIELIEPHPELFYKQSVEHHIGPPQEPASTTQEDRTADAGGTRDTASAVEEAPDDEHEAAGESGIEIIETDTEAAEETGDEAAATGDSRPAVEQAEEDTAPTEEEPPEAASTDDEKGAAKEAEPEKGKKPRRRLGLIAAAAALVFLAVCAAAVYYIGTRPAGGDSGDIPVPALPPNARIMEKLLANGGSSPEFTIRAEIGVEAQKEDVQKLLDDLFRHYTAYYHRASGHELAGVEILVYASERIWRESPGWWMGRLVWKRGGVPEMQLRMDAVLPRSAVPGYGYTTHDEYLAEVDSIQKEITMAVNGIRQLVREYDAMEIGEKQLRERAELHTAIMSGFTDMPPQPPGGDYKELHEAVETLIDEARYFQEVFPSGGDSGGGPARIDLEKLYDHFQRFYAADAVLTGLRRDFAAR